MRKKLLGVSLIIILLSLAAYGTWAYFAGEARTTNVITTGTIDITLVETTTDAEGNQVEFPTTGISGVMPGQSVDKLVTVDNVGTGESWIRAGIVCRIESVDGEELPLTLEYADGEDVLSFDINEEMWTEKDGYYYYTEPVKANTSTEQLFSQVTFNKAMGNEYQGCTAFVDVAVWAVQAKNNGETVFEAAGWSAN